MAAQAPRAADAPFRQLLTLPIVWTLVVLAGSIVLPNSALPGFFRVSEEGVKILALFGCVSVALAFEPGDYLRGAWLFNAGCFTFILLRDVTLIPGVLDSPDSALVRAALSATANALGAVFAWRFGRAWAVAELPDRSHLRAYVVAGVLAVLFAFGSLAIHVREAMAGHRAALVFVASGVGDLVSLCMIAPVIPTAMALRGGKIAWPWIMISISFAGWLLYDAIAALTTVVHVDPVARRAVLEACRTFGCLCTMTSAIAQRRVSMG